MAVRATPISWTLLFKSGTSTTLLYSNPDTSFSALKTCLLTALKARGPDLQGTPLPSRSEDIYFAKPVDAADFSQGWEPLEPTQEDEELEEAIDQMDRAGSKGKGKGKKVVMEKDCPSAAGLRDGSVVAFKFGRDTEYVVEVPSFDDGAEEDEGIEVDG